MMIVKDGRLVGLRDEKSRMHGQTGRLVGLRDEKSRMHGQTGRLVGLRDEKSRMHGQTGRLVGLRDEKSRMHGQTGRLVGLRDEKSRMHGQTGRLVALRDEKSRMHGQTGRLVALRDEKSRMYGQTGRLVALRDEKSRMYGQTGRLVALRDEKSRMYGQTGRLVALRDEKSRMHRHSGKVRIMNRIIVTYLGLKVFLLGCVGYCLLAGVLVLVSTCKAKNKADTDYLFVSYDKRFHKVVPVDARLETIAYGHTWVEGPAWHPNKDMLFFSDIPRNAIYSWQEGKGTTLFLKHSGYTAKLPFKGREPGSNGLAFDKEGRMLICEHGNRRITRLEKDGSRTVLVDHYKGRRLNSPNDLIVSSDGMSLYFTDPPFGLPKAFDDPGRDLDFTGVYRLSPIAPKASLELLTKEVLAPNGLALSPDNKTLYVSNADRKNAFYYAFPIKQDGTLGKKRVFYDATHLALEKNEGAPDGMAVDQDGKIFAAGPGGLHILDKHQKSSNCIQFFYSDRRLKYAI